MLPILSHGHVHDPLAAAILAGAVVVLYARDRIEAAGARFYEWVHEDDEEPVDATAREQYVAGDITLTEYERRVEAALDPSTSRALEVLDEADGIGEQRALQLAEAFGSVETLAAHEPAEVADEVDGIGPTYAERAVETARSESRS
ncbi:helix-hairpin-helix domain-containing protein [Haloglomus halophilum]|uniref:helix-hairpin-helix domain-containing protein n=1 Tax=Haloglomus halophilum TaxID=2962672 RepID=UPI0020C9A51F|nr:helix-hairpin-helix domain-containing protein [Haloglomus halophilum]